MKTTNYELSKKLAEIGFGINNTSIFGWFSKSMVSPMELAGKFIIADGIKEGYHFDFYSYDLETIIEALPKESDFLSRKSAKYGLRIWWEEGEEYIGYQNFEGFDRLMTLEKSEDELLADTAARLLILLVEKGIINFKGEIND